MTGSSDGFFGIPLFRPAALLGSLAYLGVPRLLSGAESPLVCRWVPANYYSLTCRSPEHRPGVENRL